MTAQTQSTATASSGRLLSSSHLATREAVARDEGEPVTIAAHHPCGTLAHASTVWPPHDLFRRPGGLGPAHAPPTRWHGLAWGLVLVATALLVWRALLAERQTVDDVFIFLRTSRNLAERGEMVFNAGAGQVRVEGTSSPAWTLLLALMWRLGGHGLGAAKAVSLVLAALLPAACALAALRATPGRALAIAVPAVALAFDADFANWASSGMDTALWTLACVVCVILADRPALAAVALGALAWVRPEGPLFTALGVAALAQDRRSLVRLALLASAPVVALTAIRLGYFHALVPNTFWAKMNAADGKDFTGGGYLASAMRAGRCCCWHFRGGAGRVATSCNLEDPAPRPGLLLATFLFAFAVAGGDWMPGRRLLVPALPLAAIVAGVVLAQRPSRFATAACLALGAEGALTFGSPPLDQDWRQHEWLDERVARWRPVARPFVDPYVARLDAHPPAPPDRSLRDAGRHRRARGRGRAALRDGGRGVPRRVRARRSPAGRVAFSPRDPALRAAAAADFFAASPAVAIVVIDESTGRPFAPAQDAAFEDPRFAAGWRELARVPSWGGHPCVTFVRRDLAPRDRVTAAARAQTWLAREPDVTALAD